MKSVRVRGASVNFADPLSRTEIVGPLGAQAFEPWKRRIGITVIPGNFRGQLQAIGTTRTGVGLVIEAIEDRRPVLLRHQQFSQCGAIRDAGGVESQCLLEVLLSVL